MCFREVMPAFGLKRGFFVNHRRRFFKKDDKNARKNTKKYKSVHLLSRNEQKETLFVHFFAPPLRKWSTVRASFFNHGLTQIGTDF